MDQVARNAGRRRAFPLPVPLPVVTPRTVAACAAAGQIATVLVTWPLWQHRSSPPNLPAIGGLAGPDYGLVLVVTAAAALLIPRPATPVFLVVLGAAIAGDQLRLQPEVVSLALLMALPVLGPTGVGISRFHLSSLWLWSGINKVLSTGWSAGGAAFIASSLGSSGLRPAVTIGLPLTELILGGASLWRRAWPVVRWLAPALHLGILLTLSPFFGDWNSAVWPWNVALAVAGFALFGPEPQPASTPPSEAAAAKATATATAKGPAGRAVVAAAGAFLLAYPALFYVGSVDAYLAHNLYTSNTAAAAVCEPTGRCDGSLFDTFGPLNVPVPPEPRLFRRLFDAACRPGQRLVITERATVFTDPPYRTQSDCPARAMN